jgi:hypothetical protein
MAEQMMVHSHTPWPRKERPPPFCGSCGARDSLYAAAWARALAGEERHDSSRGCQDPRDTELSGCQRHPGALRCAGIEGHRLFAARGKHRFGLRARTAHGDSHVLRGLTQGGRFRVPAAVRSPAACSTRGACPKRELNPLASNRSKQHAGVTLGNLCQGFRCLPQA